ncbi:MAG: hypothetical protein IJF69_03145 [Clostridia bacterium]|nr:hypothetical protein [Clostridia bacterium]
MEKSNISSKNRKVLNLLSQYINLMPDCITSDMIKETKNLCGVNTEEAFRILIAGIFDVYGDKDLRSGWFSKMFTCLDNSIYENDPYRKNILFPDEKMGEWEFCSDRYRPYELFVYDDLKNDGEGRIIPQVGFFEKEYTFPVVKQSGREWMLITPNEIETMKAPIAAAHGKVTTYGLGLGYFAYMVSQKEDVSEVTVVEYSGDVISLFEKHILPQFPCKDKIKIVHGDAFSYAAGDHPCDFVFADIWHDPSDGANAYLNFKSLEREGTEYAYWIENTIKYYI